MHIVLCMHTRVVHLCSAYYVCIHFFRILILGYNNMMMLMNACDSVPLPGPATSSAW